MKPYYQLVRHEGNQDLFRAVEMSVTATVSGYPFHIHTEGLRGTGKTTIMRAAASILPPITRIKHCLYNCDPANPHCPEHRGLTAEQIAAIGVEEVPRPFLEISHGAKISTIIGSIDLTKLTDPLRPVAALLPGTIPQAHRGIVFVDEINRLADASPEIADVLLDVMGTKPGRIQIEEAGLATVEMPVNVTVWAASNPDEEPGALTQIRKQLSDRFDMSICMGRPNQVESVLDILMNRATFEPAAEPQGVLLAGMDMVSVDEAIKKVLASIYVDYGLESLRAVEALEKAARLQGLRSGHERVLTADVAQIVPLVLSHRTDPATIANILTYLEHIGDNIRKNRLIPADVEQPGCFPPTKQQQAAVKARSRLAEWWNRLRDRLSPAEQKTNHAAGGIMPEQPGGRGGSVTRRQQITDPAGLTIIAPPKAAVPLANLNLDEFVSTDEKAGAGR